MTHDDLVKIAYRWVLRNGSCGFAFRELSNLGDEIPDVIGFGSGDHSVLIECKVSRSDFFADQKKTHRRNGTPALGKYRLYCVPEGLIDEKEVPAKWGLIYVNGRGWAKAVINPVRHRYSELYDHEFHSLAERALMYSALRRLHLRNRIDEIYEERPEQ